MIFENQQPEQKKTLITSRNLVDCSLHFRKMKAQKGEHAWLLVNYDDATIAGFVILERRL